MLVIGSIAAIRAGVKAARTRLPMTIHKLAARRFCMPFKNASLVRGLICTFGASRTTVSNWIKKVAQLSLFSTTLVAPDPEGATSIPLELDERWSFVLKKANQVWVW